MKNHSRHGPHRHYWMFGVNMLLSLIVMYAVMFSMIDGWGDFRNNLNMFYMALTMVAPMGVIMLLTMRGMYSDARLNRMLHAGLAALFVVAFMGTRTQALIGDEQFIASMIPHHSGAILMCRKAEIRDRQLFDLCARIEQAQREEIERMEVIAERLRDNG